MCMIINVISGIVYFLQDYFEELTKHLWNNPLPLVDSLDLSTHIAQGYFTHWHWHSVAALILITMYVAMTLSVNARGIMPTMFMLIYSSIKVPILLCESDFQVHAKVILTTYFTAMDDDIHTTTKTIPDMAIKVREITLLAMIDGKSR